MHKSLIWNLPKDMFNFFKRKPKLPPKDPFADLQRAELAAAVRSLLASEPPAAGLMTIVAVSVLRSLKQAAQERDKRGDKSNIRYSYKDMATIEFMMRQTYASYNDKSYGELERLRPYWLYLGACVIKASDGISADDSAEETVSEIWSYLIAGLPYVKGALTNNQLWDKDEKRHFFQFIVDSEPSFGIDVLLMMCKCPPFTKYDPKCIRAREDAIKKLQHIT